MRIPSEIFDALTSDEIALLSIRLDAQDIHAIIPTKYDTGVLGKHYRDPVYSNYIHKKMLYGELHKVFQCTPEQAEEMELAVDIAFEDLKLFEFNFD